MKILINILKFWFSVVTLVSLDISYFLFAEFSDPFFFLILWHMHKLKFVFR